MNRRDFLTKSTQAGAGFALGGFLARAYGNPSAVGPLAATAISPNDRVLVIVRLDGGNDGLNTLIPFESNDYYNSRPNIAIPAGRAKINRLTETNGLHPALSGFRRMFDSGTMTAVQGVGYPNPNRSHFRATDIWLTGSESDEVLNTGWLGRYLEAVHPDFPNTLPSQPLAIDIGPVLSLSLLGRNGGLGIALRDPQEFFDLVNLGNKNVEGSNHLTPAGFELDFIRQVNIESIQYSSQIRSAAERGRNAVEYPDTTLAQQLAMISRLIAGGLRSRIYLVSQRGYDTHSNQDGRQEDLLKDLDEAIFAFQNDLDRLGQAHRTLGMTISEFGRRVAENGSAGTDHGTAAPLFLFGPEVKGGIVGPDPNFRHTDSRGDFHHTYDFRQVYASLLKSWFEVPADLISSVLPGQSSFLPLLNEAPDLEAVDFTGDGKVDFSDFLSFARGFGQEDPAYDVDGDGQTGFSDFVSFARGYGKHR
ncbi:MAG: hypothetical protein CME26_01365 [Gemmatimonadetes bacterium]|nr:hypothetical protein [Gemmatimonadota bacterium]|tara:strand:- start:3549 stop:4976 length:1428 start_codon:yes stop_codon:yes gene_type:complete